MADSEGVTSDVMVREDVVTDERAVEIAELGVEASEVRILEMVDLEGWASEGAASEAAVTEVANTGNCGGDGRQDRAIVTSIFRCILACL